MKFEIEVPAHDCTRLTGVCLGCRKWLEYLECWYADKERGFRNVPIADIKV